MDPNRLAYVYEGWEGYNRALVNALQPLTPEQLAFRGTSEMRSVAELAWHIADGRVDWFQRLYDEPDEEHSGNKIPYNPYDTLSPHNLVRPSGSDIQDLIAWYATTWSMIEATLDRWTAQDLPVTFEQPYQGKVFAVSRQWVIWRIMAHDIHHGGQLSELLAMQGLLPLELTLLGGHLTEPPEVGH